MKRCQWVTDDPIYIKYHDEEWGVPVWDDRKLFEFILLEGAQAGLSWITILKRREGYRKAFENFNPKKIARFTDEKLQKLGENRSIIRNRLKIEAARKNARAFLKIQEEFGSFSKYQWSFVSGEPIQNRWKKHEDIPTETNLSKTISKDLKKRGFQFVGPTIIYAHMQAVGMVDDHLTTCFRYPIREKI
jgi:DNA-3-methyladenine glycosylase I